MFEMMMIINAKLTSADQKKKIERVKEIITEKKGKVEKAESLGTKRFAYPIDHMQEGHYVLFYFDAKEKPLTQIKRQFTLEEDIVRYMIIRQG